ncbi:MAG: DNA gyrase inhibitor YacG [Acidobacteriota bacterium]
MKIRCPVCREWTTWEENPHKPFCSKRCKLIDLGAWASEEYRVPGKKEEEEDETRNEDHEQ